MRILVAGVGNIFLGDDGFGVEVGQAARRARTSRAASRSSTSGSAASTSPTSSRRRYDTTILVDTVPRGTARPARCTCSNR